MRQRYILDDKELFVSVDAYDVLHVLLCTTSRSLYYKEHRLRFCMRHDASPSGIFLITLVACIELGVNAPVSERREIRTQ